MDDRAVGAGLRAARHRLRLTQAEIATQAGVGRWVVAQLEGGRIGPRRVRDLRVVASVLGGRVSIEFQWRGGELGRVLNAGHAAMHEAVARRFAGLPGWVSAAEVTFSRWGERGVIDRLAWHAGAQIVLVIELKTELVDLENLLSTMDRRARLAPEIARERGWSAERVGRWIVLADTPTNRRRLAAHVTLLRSAYPDDGRTMRRWLRDPAGVVAALSFLSIDPGSGTNERFGPVRRRR